MLERIALTWLKERQANGISAPVGTEEDIAERDPEEALHHLASYFTPEHGAVLASAAEREKDTSKAAQYGKTPLTLTSNLTQGLHQSSNPDAELKHLTLARAEIGAAWLQAVVLRPPSPPASATTGPSSSLV